MWMRDFSNGISEIRTENKEEHVFLLQSVNLSSKNVGFKIFPFGICSVSYLANCWEPVLDKMTTFFLVVWVW